MVVFSARFEGSDDAADAPVDGPGHGRQLLPGVSLEAGQILGRGLHRRMDRIEGQIHHERLLLCCLLPDIGGGSFGQHIG